jgi:hypothetical protein
MIIGSLLTTLDQIFDLCLVYIDNIQYLLENLTFVQFNKQWLLGQFGPFLTKIFGLCLEINL